MQTQLNTENSLNLGIALDTIAYFFRMVPHFEAGTNIAETSEYREASKMIFRLTACSEGAEG